MTTHRSLSRGERQLARSIFGAAIDYVEAIGLDTIHAHEAALVGEVRNELRHIQESVRYLGEVNGKQAAGMFLSDAYQHQARLSPEGMWIKRKHLVQAREFIDTLIGAIQ